jgi:glycerol-3-phosphate dehydrogenase
LFEGEQAYILQHSDGRVIFIIPYERDFTLVGTTDIAYDGDPGEVVITEAEATYLCEAVNRYLAKPIDAKDAVWTYAGVRPLYDDASANVSAVTRDYVFDIDLGEGQAPLLSIFGGKITTYRKLAEHALAKLQPHMGFTARPWTEDAVLPGGDLPDADFERFLAGFKAARPWLPPRLAERYARAYGTRAERFLGRAESLEDLGEDLGGGLYEAEAAYLVAEEWATSAEDILFRRSKLGLHVPEGTGDRLAAWLANHGTAAQSRVAAR